LGGLIVLSNEKFLVKESEASIARPFKVCIFENSQSITMNFLAHIFLSGDDELLKIGNFMADGIRGNSTNTSLCPYKKAFVCIALSILTRMRIPYLEKVHKDFTLNTITMLE